MSCAQRDIINKKRIIEALNALVACMPSGANLTGLQALINQCCTLWDAQAIYDLIIQRSICYLQTQIQNGPGTIVINGGVDYIIEQLVFSDNIFIWECFAKSFSFPTLEVCQQGLYFSTNTTDGNMSFLTSIDLPVLTQIVNQLFVTRIPNLTIISAPLLTDVGNDINVSSNTRLRTVDFHSLVNLGNNFEASGSLLEGLDLPNLASWLGPEWKCDSNAIPSADVNALLIKFDSFGVVGRLIDFSGGANGPPTGAGLTAKAALILAGNTVNTN